MVYIKGNVERIAETTEQEEKLKKLGFQPLGAEEPLEEKADQGTSTPTATEQDLSVMKVPELKALAKEKGIEGSDSLNKEELLTVLKGVIASE